MQFATIEAFWHDDPDRNRSEETDFGYHWRRPGDPYRWRVSYIRNTGEVYAVRLAPQEGPLLVLGRVPQDPEADNQHSAEGRDQGNLYNRTVNRILKGWNERCTSPDGLEWLESALEEAGYGAPRK